MQAFHPAFVIMLTLFTIIPSQAGEEAFHLSGEFDDWYYKKTKPYQGWKYIVIHHSATDSGSVKAFDRFHKQQGYGGVAYHYIIGNGKGMKDGEVAETFRWKDQISGTHSSVHAWKHNIFGIGICLVGNLENSPPTPQQKAALIALSQKLMKEYNIPANKIMGHRHVPYDQDPKKHEKTACPGNKMQIDALIQDLST